ncbi:guanine nucleotide-binding protein subunit alpha [Trichophyton rubrum CBS 735.88]|nr:guanine nucleotide-binding protein subunit alpha [Trichophyton rubrum CBS 735.88]
MVQLLIRAITHATGAGESGKSTILKQMKLIHEGSYSRDERESFKEIIFSNTVQSMRVILEAMESLELPLDDQRAEYHVHTIFMQPAQIEGDSLPPEVGSAIEALWKDAGVQECFKRSREYQLNDSARYYFDSIGRIAAPDYLPNDQDVLRSRVKTTGITETTFIIGDLTYRMFDVGGQRSERKKWIHCFENVTTILFLVAISEYDQLLFEDETVNRMQEALTLFDSICNSRWFINTSIILFLNKIDRFKEKLPVSPMKNYFPDYEGGADYSAACDYILNRFVSLNQAEQKQIYTHFTCATDTTQIRFVMAAVNGMLSLLNPIDEALSNNISRHHHTRESPTLRSHIMHLSLFFFLKKKRKKKSQLPDLYRGRCLSLSLILRVSDIPIINLLKIPSNQRDTSPAFFNSPVPPICFAWLLRSFILLFLVFTIKPQASR